MYLSSLLSIPPYLVTAPSTKVRRRWIKDLIQLVYSKTYIFLPEHASVIALLTQRRYLDFDSTIFERLWESDGRQNNVVVLSGRPKTFLREIT